MAVATAVRSTASGSCAALAVEAVITANDRATPRCVTGARQQLLAAEAEDERVAALQAHDRAPEARLLDRHAASICPPGMRIRSMKRSC